jgi:GAF domain-containing protein
MYARNFYIALYDEATEIISFPYFVDEFDPPSPAQRLNEGGLTAYVLRTGRPEHIPTEKFQALINQGEIEQIGSPPVDWLGLPLKTEGRTLGALVVQSYTTGIVYSDQDLEVLTFVSQHIATALERVRLLEETLQRNTELAAINQVQAALVAELNVQAIYRLVGDQIRDIFDAQVVMIGTYDHQLEMILDNYYYEMGEQPLSDPLPYNALHRHLITTREPVLINENAVQARARFKLRPIPDTEVSKSLLFVPQVVGETVKGYISLQNLDHEHAFSESDVRLLTTLANSLSIALENARLFTETNRLLAESNQRASELATVNTVSQALVAELELDTLIELIGEQMRRTFNADIVYVALHEPQSDLIQFPYA